MHLIFVYGTLKSDFYNNHLISNQKLVTTGVTKDEAFKMLDLGAFPGVVGGDMAIKGEVWEVDDAAFERCDRLEGHPVFYCRQKVMVSGDDGEEYECWMYIYMRPAKNLDTVESGEWKAR